MSLEVKALSCAQSLRKSSIRVNISFSSSYVCGKTDR